MDARGRAGARPCVPRLQLAEVLEAALARPGASDHLSAHQHKVLGAILACQTPALGGHLYRCLDCGAQHFIPHSCRNRHCPRCQKAKAIEWLEKQSESLLPVPYFHLVFTLPHLLNPLIRQNQRALYKLLFDCASRTLLEFGERRFGAEIGVTAVLHTWSQTLAEHYHLHCIVTGGGLLPGAAGWRSSGATYLFPIAALSKVFRAKFCAGINQLREAGEPFRQAQGPEPAEGLEFHGQLESLADPEKFADLMRGACAKEWVVFSKPPFGGPQAVLAYLSRYTHRVAIASGRLLELDRAAGTIRFSYKDYADGSRHKTMTLGLDEFLRRFALHILPERFVKIRHYGLLGNRNRSHKIALAKECLGVAPQDDKRAAESSPKAERALPESSQMTQPSATAPTCPKCGARRMKLIAHFLPGGIERRCDFLDSS